MAEIKRMRLFEAYGTELEYMIVDRETLNVKPISDQLLQSAAGAITDEFDNGAVTWSNELVMHVIELKCTVPTPDYVALNNAFAANVEQINKLLEAHNAMLMPSAAHPWMNPEKETKLWPHGSSDIYQTYDRIFGCKGHGWSNLQSTHLNLPFYDNQEFAKLHTAARLILPLLPAIAASSPILEQEFTGVLDKRMVYYQHNQKRVPSITGLVIPEKVLSRRQYQKMIYDRIAEDVAPLDTEKVLQPVWLNSRGIIARFDRGSIEIRILDIQECPKADIAILNLVIHLIKMLVDKSLSPYTEQLKWKTGDLHEILQRTIRKGHKANIDNVEYLKTLGVEGPATGTEVWKQLLKKVTGAYPDAMAPWVPTLETMLERGVLADAILREVGDDYTRENLQKVYGKLGKCLATNTLFMP